MKRGYDDPEAALSPTLDEMFWVLDRRGRRQSTFLAYLLNVDVLGHKGGQERAAAALVEIDRRIQEFKARHPGRYRFTLFGDHGNAHVKARLIDPRAVLREVGVTPVATLGRSGVLEAVPVVHVRVTYVALHTRPEQVEEVAERTSRHADIQLAVARLGPAAVAGLAGERFAIWRQGQRLSFLRGSDGRSIIEAPDHWRAALGLDLSRWSAPGAATASLSDAEGFELLRDSAFPDLLQRVASAFTHAAAQFRADVLLSLPDDVASYGFHVPGSGDGVAIDGFHGGLGRGGSLSVLASESMVPAAMVRADDLLDLFPALRPGVAR